MLNIRWPRLTVRGVLGMAALGVLFTVVGGGALARALNQPGPMIYLIYGITAVADLSCLPIMQTVVLNAPSPRLRPGMFLLLHLVGFALYSLLAMVLLRQLSALLLSSYKLPRLEFVAQARIDLPNYAVVYAAATALWSAVHAHAARREAAQSAAELDARLADTQVQSLRARLDPELVLSALSELRRTMQVDLKRAEGLVLGLADRLRAALVPDQPASGSDSTPNATVRRERPAQAQPPGAWRFRWPVLPVRAAALLLPCLLGLGLVQGSVVPAEPYGGPLASYTYLSAAGIALWFSIPLAATAVVNGRGASIVRITIVHALGLGSFAAAHVGIARALRKLVAVWLSVDLRPTTFWFDLQLDLGKELGLYIGLCALGSAFYAWEERTRLALYAASIEAQLSHLQLTMLLTRVEPHFLYNALNTVCSLMYEDVPRTQQLIDSLSQLLRAAASDASAVWSLAQEAALTSRFVDLMQARFGDRLGVSWQLPDDLARTEVPRFSLQVLVENAIKHNQRERRALRVQIVAGQRGSQVVIAVSDNGQGFGAAPENAFGGLRRLGEILQLLYGGRAQLSRSSSPERGACVELALPEAAP